MYDDLLQMNCMVDLLIWSPVKLSDNQMMMMRAMTVMMLMMMMMMLVMMMERMVQHLIKVYTVCCKILLSLLSHCVAW